MSGLIHKVTRKITVAAVTLSSLVCAAQSPLEDGTLKLPRTVKDETVAPSPEAPAVIRPRANTVLYSRGLVTESRELMSLRSGSLTVPVTISYTATGVRTDDDGSLAGLGWTLECGGTVSRTVKGRPDEQRGIRVDAASKVSRRGDVSYLHDVLRGAVDADYDRYSYSVAGYSGSFIIRDGTVVQLPRTDVDIRLTGAEREGVRDFLIQTPSGERYLFGEREHTEYTYRPSTQTANATYISPDYRAVSGWHLTEAVSADGCDTVRISYTATRHEREEVTDRLYCVTMSHSSGGGYSGGDIPSGLYSVSRTAYPDKRIPSRVTGRGYELLIETDSGGGYRRISRMELRNAGGPMRMLEKRGYDPVGRLSHITSPGADITYGYNIRGWVTGIDGGAAFRQRLYYAEESGQSLPLYSGDISRNEWTSRIVGEAGYSYFYDRADRLAEARYSGDGHYSSGYSYDVDGNLTGIVRIGTEVDGTETVVDDLTLTYSGNRLVSVSDRGEDTGAYGVMEFVDRSGSTEEYAYDANGNLTRDLNKDIVEISYNPINLPGEIRFADGSKISYVYDADGHKWRERYTDAEGRQIFRRDYDGSRVYRDGILERIVTPCGYVTGGRIYTCVKDYQGNVRSVVRQDGRIIEATDYYPYGAPYSTERNVQPYKYGGKELNRMHGLDLYDSRARHYDPLLGRTTTMDSEAETTPWLSPYAWCNGNPIRFTDPTGKYVETVWDVANFVMDAVSFADNVKKGDALGAAIDVIGMAADAAAIIMPGVPGGAGSAIRAFRATDKAVDVSKAAVHGNSRFSTKAQHIYEIYDTKTGEVVKTGISGGKVSKQGKSYRATKQVNKWNKEEGAGKYDSRIVEHVPEGPNARHKALETERRNANRLKQIGQLQDKNKHQKP